MRLKSERCAYKGDFNLNWKRAVLNTFKWLFVIVPLAFLVKVLVENYGKVAPALKSARLDYVLISIFAFLLMTFFWGLMWHFMTLAVGVGLPIRRALAAYFTSQLGKFLPGKVWMMAARFAIYHSELADAPRVSVAVILEAALHLGGQLLLLVALALFYTLSGYESLRIVALVILLALLIGSHPRALQFALNVAMRILKKPLVELKLAYAHIIALYLGYALVYSFGVIGVLLLYQAFAPLSSSLLLPISLASVISGVGGMLVIFVPAGLGVREGLMYGILVNFVPQHIAALLPVASRFLTGLAQAVWILLGLWGFKKMGIKIDFKINRKADDKKDDELTQSFDNRSLL